MNPIIQKIYTQAQSNLQKIVLADAHDSRIQAAAKIATDQKIADIILLTEEYLHHAGGAASRVFGRHLDRRLRDSRLWRRGALGSIALSGQRDADGSAVAAQSRARRAPLCGYPPPGRVALSAGHTQRSQEDDCRNRERGYYRKLRHGV